MPRVARNHLPVVADPNNSWVKEQAEVKTMLPFKMIGAACFYMYAANQFSKIYFPHGIVLRNSIPTTWAQYIAHRAPIGLFFLGYWYYQREYPRSERVDLTCDSEE